MKRDFEVNACLAQLKGMRLVETIVECYDGKFGNRGMLANIALEVGALPAVRRLVNSFDDRGKYPDRPMITIREDHPAIYLLGWREGDWTEPHDHGNSEVAVHVVQGIVTEDLYVTANTAEKDREILMEWSRDAMEGQIITCPPVRYIHKVGNVRPETAATLHVYGPVLNDMTLYQREGNWLRFVEHWTLAGENAHH